MRIAKKFLTRLLDRLTVGGMKHWGLRATFLSSYTELDAWKNARITT
jgi:hypothetical protein